jgi:peroxiredoxin
MSIHDKLVALKISFGDDGVATRSAEAQEALSRLIAAEERERPFRVGDIAPGFALHDANNVLVSLEELLRRGPAVLTFYRGLWCPYCQRDLQSFEGALPDLYSADASVVAVSHQLTSDTSRQFGHDNPISFPVLEDETGDIAVQFGLRWAPKDLQLIQEQLGTNLGVFHGTDPWIVPMQARYVIGQDGVIAFAEVAFDYSQRSDPTAVLPVLDRLKGAR